VLEKPPTEGDLLDFIGGTMILNDRWHATAAGQRVSLPLTFDLISAGVNER
jgi:hypothetical protein